MKTDYEIVTMDATERQMWRYPFTSILTVLLGCSLAFGLIYTFAFSDTTRDVLDHAFVSLATFSVLGLLLALAKKKEEKTILPRWARRLVWLGIIACYIAVAAWLVTTPGDPVRHFWLSLKLGTLGILPFFAWRLLKDKDA